MSGGYVIIPLLIIILAATQMQLCALLIQLLKAPVGRHALWLCSDVVQMLLLVGYGLLLQQ